MAFLFCFNFQLMFDFLKMLLGKETWLFLYINFLFLSPISSLFPSPLSLSLSLSHTHIITLSLFLSLSLSLSIYIYIYIYIWGGWHANMRSMNKKCPIVLQQSRVFTLNLFLGTIEILYIKFYVVFTSSGVHVIKMVNQSQL